MRDAGQILSAALAVFLLAAAATLPVAIALLIGWAAVVSLRRRQREQALEPCGRRGAQATLRRRALLGDLSSGPRLSASPLASTALAHETSPSSPGAATMSPARYTPSPRSTAGRSRQLVPGMSSAPERASSTWRRRQCHASTPLLEADVEQPLEAKRGAVGALAGTDRHLRLDRAPRRVARRAGWPPSSARSSRPRPGRRRSSDRRGDDAARGPDTACGRSPAQALVAEQLARLAELRGDDHRRRPAARSTRVAVSTVTPSLRTRRSSEATSVLQPPTG